MEKEVPNPGSPEAVDQGCSCPVIDNQHGVGAWNGEPGEFWYDDACPIHKPKGG